MRIGIFGGTFNPVHYGHLLLAETCREQRGLDEVWFLPASVPPHKQDLVLVDAAQRLEMLKLAAGGNEAFRVSDLELKRGGVSYTVDTLEAVHAERPEAELYLLIGADTLADLPNWRTPKRVCELALPTAVCRPGSGELDYEPLAAFVEPTRLARLRELRVEMPQIGISSRDLRARIAAGKSIRYQVPRAVEKFIETAGLYR
ncbi:MAG: nicotinate (nicotinamide) nucleotide adenylyltransferase [Pirellula sp.]|nr:nicotinate (nicotinamide) nucleotide adenylyltransferase [Pirellula sp.]